MVSSLIRDFIVLKSDASFSTGGSLGFASLLCVGTTYGVAHRDVWNESNDTASRKGT